MKARHFVAALRDHYRQRAEDKGDKAQATPGISDKAQATPSISDKAQATPGNSDKDRRAVEWITPNRLRALMEAFDDDASDFITVTEVNQLTSSRPQTWRYVIIVGIIYLLSALTMPGDVAYHIGSHTGR